MAVTIPILPPDELEVARSGHGAGQIGKKLLYGKMEIA